MVVEYLAGNRLRGTSTERTALTTLTTTEQTTSNSDGNSSLGGSAGANVKLGAKFNTGHDIIGKTVSSVSIKTSSYGSPSGTAYLKIYDSSLDLIATSTNGKDLTDMAGEAQSVYHTTTFNFEPYVTFVDGYIVSFEGGTTSDGNEVNVQASNVGTDASNTEYGWYQTSWSWQSGRDMWLDYSYISAYPNIQDGSIFYEKNTNKSHVLYSGIWSKVA